MSQETTGFDNRKNHDGSFIVATRTEILRIFDKLIQEFNMSRDSRSYYRGGASEAAMDLGSSERQSISSGIPPHSGWVCLAF